MYFFFNLQYCNCAQETRSVELLFKAKPKSICLVYILTYTVFSWYILEYFVITTTSISASLFSLFLLLVLCGGGGGGGL